MNAATATAKRNSEMLAAAESGASLVELALNYKLAIQTVQSILAHQKHIRSFTRGPVCAMRLHPYTGIEIGGKLARSKPAAEGLK